MLCVSDWGTQYSWTGLRNVGGVWRWHGRVTSAVSTNDAIWYGYGPCASQSNNCGFASPKSDPFEKIYDTSCTFKLHYICERHIGQ